MNKVLEKKSKKTMDREQFLEELALVIPNLPYHYGVIIKNLYPEIDMRKVYNVIHYKIHDEEILKKLQLITPSFN